MKKADHLRFEKKQENRSNLINTGKKILLAGLIACSITGLTQAAATLSLSDGINPIVTITDNGPGDMNGSTGAILLQTNIGVWYLNISSAVTKPLFGSATDPVMSLLALANSSAGGTLQFTFSDDFFGPASGTLVATDTGHGYSGAPATVSYDVYGDPGNNVGARTVLIASMGPSPLPVADSASGPLTLAAPYSLTQVLSITAADATGVSVNASFNVVPVPEPGIASLIGLALATLTLPYLREKRNGSKAVS